MGIKGFQGTSLLDFPGRIASLVFWGGCNLTCPFCHNPPLVLEPEAYPDISSQDILANLEERRSFIDGVVVSGGEPTIDSGLPSFLQEVKALGLLVKLDTNGLAPDVIGNLAENRLIDYLAIDLKTTPERYPELHHGPVAHEKLSDTIQLCVGLNVTLEYRTTCVPGWIDEDVIEHLGEYIDGAPLWTIQQFHPEHSLCQQTRSLRAYSASRLQALATQAERFVEKVVVRGV